MKKKLICLGLTFVLSLTMLAGCGSKKEASKTTDDTKQEATEEKKSIKIGCMSSSEPIVQIIADGLKDQGIEVEAVLFDLYPA